jgi:hypothetical protein
MATSEHGSKAEIAASVHHSPGQQSLEPAIEETTVQASLSAVLDTSGETTCERETLSTDQISGAFFDHYARSELDIIHSEYRWAQEVGINDTKL